MKADDTTHLPKAALILGEGNSEKVFPAPVRAGLEEMCDIVLDTTPREAFGRHRAELAEVRFLFGGWGGPCLDREKLSMLPALEALFHAAGSLKHTVGDGFWESGVKVCSAWAANAVPVAEFTFAQIIIALKQVLRLYGKMEKSRAFVFPENQQSCGTFGTTVGLVSLGQIGIRVANLLKNLDVRVIAYDPFIDPEAAGALRIETVDLDQVFSRAQVVSLHTPLLPETEGMIRGRHFLSMPSHATFINTARGAVVNESEMIDALRERQDLTAVLDVTYPEPAPPDSPLYSLENVFLSPHIAGSYGGECARMGQFMVDECRRLLAGQPLQWSITEEAFAKMA